MSLALVRSAEDERRAALERLRPWERNFLRLYASGGLESVRVELGSVRERPDPLDREYGPLHSEADCQRVRDAIAARLRAPVAAAPPRFAKVEARDEGGDHVAQTSATTRPAAPEPEPAPSADDSAGASPRAQRITESITPGEAVERPASAAEPAPPEALHGAGEAAAATSDVVDEVLDDFGAARPGPKAIGRAKSWQPDEPKACGECDRRFWPEFPGQRYCPEHRGTRNAERRSRQRLAERRRASPNGPVGSSARRVEPIVVAATAAERAAEVARYEADLPPAEPPAVADPEPEPDRDVVASLDRHVTQLSGEVDDLRARLGRAHHVIADQSAAVHALREEVHRLRQLVEAPDLDALDVPLSHVMRALAALGRRELDRGEFLDTLRPHERG